VFYVDDVFIAVMLQLNTVDGFKKTTSERSARLSQYQHSVLPEFRDLSSAIDQL